MTLLEITRTVECPESGERSNVDDECCFCEFYGGAESCIENAPMVCNYGEGEEE